MIRRPEIGAFIVMMIIVLALAVASDMKAFNALGLKHNIKLISQYGIIAIGASMLMIAGEFDLSIGSMIGFAGMSMALMLKWGLPFGLGEATPFLAFIITLAMTLTFGWFIGTVVVRSGLSSFIVTLAFLFFLRGVTEVGFRLINGSTQVSGLPDYKENSWFADILGGEVFGWFYDAWFAIGKWVTADWVFEARLTIEQINALALLNINRRLDQWVTGFDARFLWFIIIAIVAYFILSRTQVGNWIYATGDNKEAARANGVPVNRVKIGLFMFTAFCATMFAACQVFDTNTSDAAKGNLMELFAIAIAVVGGTLMTGGFGTVLGVVFGAITVGRGANAAVFANERIRKRITGGI